MAVGSFGTGLLYMGPFCLVQRAQGIGMTSGRRPTRPRPPADRPDDDGIRRPAIPTQSSPPSGPTPIIAVEATAVEAGERLDRLLAARLPEMSRSRLQALIRAGAVRDDGGTIGEPGRRVKPGERFELALPEPVAAAPAAEAIALTVVFEDAHLIVVDKPAGLVVHPAPGHQGGTLVNALIAHCGTSLSGIGGVRRPGIVHRLDKDTSGLLVVAKTDAAHQGLAAQFSSHGADGRLLRAYVALAWGCPPRARGTIEAALARSERNRKKIAVVARGGRRAATHYEVVESFAAGTGTPVAARLRLTLETGRTHQIRVHLAHLGHPVLGDPVYGAGFKSSARLLSDTARDRLAALERQALHAAELGFEHPIEGRRLSFTSPCPDDIEGLISALRGMKSPDARNRKRR
ncbi:MAG: RluA family pseudouridine synthase [Hyphomicrobium sp.]